MNFIAVWKNRILPQLRSIDVLFLVFLVLILNVSTAVKILALLIVFLFQFNFKFGLKQKRLPVFYLLITGLSLIQMIFNYDQWSISYFFLSFFGISFWIMSFLIIHQIKLFIEKKGTEIIDKTLSLFFILNIIVSFYNIISIILETGVLNPYSYTGMDFKYHMSTGDYVRGIFFDLSLTNSLISFLGIIYFFYLRQIMLSLLCLIVVLLTTSNVVFVLLTLFFLYVLFLDKKKFNKSVIICFIGIVIVFFTRISLQSSAYIVNTITPSSRIDLDTKQNLAIQEKKQREEIQKKEIQNHLDSLEKKRTGFATAQTDSSQHIKHLDIKSEEIQVIQEKIEKVENNQENKKSSEHADWMKEKHENILNYVKNLYGDSLTESNTITPNKYPGKAISFIETIRYSTSGIKEAILGSGAGLFSSKLAFKASGIGDFGKYPPKYSYISTNFKNNHLRIYSYYFIQPIDKHSVVNTPFSAANQLLGEYGIIGVMLFFIYYLWYFVKHYKKLTYGKIIIPFFLIFLLTDYWFENLSVVIIFEIMMLLDIARTKTPEKLALQSDEN